MSKRFAILAITAGLLIAACGGPAATTRPSGAASVAPSTGAPSSGASNAPATSTSAGSTDAPSEPPAGVEGNVDIHGSSTVAPISNAVAEDFQLLNPNFSYFVGDEGTGAGFTEFFCVGTGDIADASRQMRADDSSDTDDEEATICATNAVEWVELKVAYDGLAVITHPDNAIECLTFADLYALLGPEADSAGPDGSEVANWNDAETLAQELGSTTDLPDASLSITAPGDESGTYDSFIELTLGDLIEERFPDDPDSATRLRTPGSVYVASANDNAIIQGVSGFPTSLGFVGLAYAEENADQVKILGVDGGEGCVVPSSETVSDGSYPISRPLFIYPNVGRAAENRALAAYVDFYLSDAGIANASEVGYVALPADELTATRDAWQAARP